MNVGSLFSGIGGLDLGLARAGFRHSFFCESDPWRRAVLRRHWPGVPYYEDVRDVESRKSCGIHGRGDEPLSQEGRAGRNGDQVRGGTHTQSGMHAVDLLCGGFPCQDLSVAGRRAGLVGERSSLFFEFARVADALRPRWLLVENVPGLLSSSGGRDFAVVLATLAEFGYGVAWRVLDSRHFGVPQRRRRVFVIGHLGADGTEPFLPFLEGGSGDSEAGGTAGENVAYALADGSGNRTGSDRDGQDTFVTANTLKGQAGKGGSGVGPEHNLVTAFHMLQDPISERNAAPAWGKGNGQGTASIGVATGSAVRRLTPTECCRLQGFPDDWLGPPNQPPDSPRYAALGDAVTVPVAEWIGWRILEAEATVAA